MHHRETIHKNLWEKQVLEWCKHIPVCIAFIDSLFKGQPTSVWVTAEPRDYGINTRWLHSKYSATIEISKYGSLTTCSHRKVIQHSEMALLYAFWCLFHTVDVLRRAFALFSGFSQSASLLTRIVSQCMLEELLFRMSALSLPNGSWWLAGNGEAHQIMFLRFWCCYTDYTVSWILA